MSNKTHCVYRAGFVLSGGRYGYVLVAGPMLKSSAVRAARRLGVVLPGGGCAGHRHAAMPPSIAAGHVE